MTDKTHEQTPVIPAGRLPAHTVRDLPESIPWRRMVGPSIVLAGLALGSGEFVIWPHIVFRSGFVFFWACILGVATQFFLNMEIERWTLATGESATTGFCRLSRHWAWSMLLLTVIPFAWPGWATGAGNILSWMTLGPVEQTDPDGTIDYVARFAVPFAIGGLILAGVILTSGPVVYRTVERIQGFLVSLILVLVTVLAIFVVRSDAIVAMCRGIVNVGGLPDTSLPDLSTMTLLGALAFAGAGGALNLGQSNFIKDKGYGMGAYVGRITSPVTGQEEADSGVGYCFPLNDTNLTRWRSWWRNANIEHTFSFLLTCVVCLCLMSLISYSLFYDAQGELQPAAERTGGGMNFVWAQAQLLSQRTAGTFLKFGFLVMGVAVLLTTELGILDAVARVCSDVVKVNYLPNVSLSHLYFIFLWGEILLGVVVLLSGLDQPLLLLQLSAAMNGGVMFIYSIALLYMNCKVLPHAISTSARRFVVMIWSCAFFGYFTISALTLNVWPTLKAWLSGTA